MSADERTIGTLAEAIVSMVNRLVVDQNATFPIHVAAMGLNGSVECVRVELSGPTGAKCHRIVGKLVDGTFTFPINLMVVDGSGTGYLAVIGAGGASLH